MGLIRRGRNRTNLAPKHNYARIWSALMPKPGRMQEMRGQRPRGICLTAKTRRTPRQNRQESILFSSSNSNGGNSLASWRLGGSISSWRFKNQTAHTRMSAVLYGESAPTRLCAPAATGLARGVGRGLERRRIPDRWAAQRFAAHTPGLRVRKR